MARVILNRGGMAQLRYAQRASRIRASGVPSRDQYRNFTTKEEKAMYSQLLRAGGVSRSSSGGSA